MKIAIDYRTALGAPTGIGRFTKEMVRAIAQLDPSNRYVLYAAIFRRFRERIRDVPAATASIEPCVRRFPGKILAIVSRVLPISAETFTGPVDLFHLTDYIYPPVRSERVLYTIHDISFEVNSEWYDSEVVRILRAAVEKRIDRGDSILTVSDSSRREIVARYGVSEDRVHVAPLGVDRARFRPRSADETAAVLDRHGIEGPYAIAVGTIQPRKNLGVLLEGLRVARSRGLPWRLVIVGPPGWRCEEELRTIDAMEREGAVRHLGYTRDEDLPALLSGAAALGFPSHHEGFGLPVLEAMASGTPVVASGAPAVVEVAGDTAWRIDPQSPESVADALLEIAEDSALRDRRVEAGLERSKRFTWEECARAVLDAYRRIVGRVE